MESIACARQARCAFAPGQTVVSTTGMSWSVTRNLDAYAAGEISFAELDASVQGWINHVRYADTWNLREHMLATRPIVKPP